jgi:hypothetical protein
MILKASQRSGGQNLGRHLLNAEDNEQVEVHEVSGFLSESVLGAMKEAQAMAMGTRCQQYLFSVSLSPPETESVAVEVFEGAISEDRRESWGCKASPVWWCSMRRKAAAMPIASGRALMPRP